jgi:hypothetical protein
MKKTNDWKEIEEILFSLHIRFCPLIEKPTDKIKQSDCDMVKEELRKSIQDLLSVQKAKFREIVPKKKEGVIQNCSDSWNACREQILKYLENL